MAIDQNSRNRLLARQSQNQLNTGLTQIANSMEAVKANTSTTSIVDQLITELESVNQRFENRTNEQLRTLVDAFKKNELTDGELQNLKQLVNTVNSKLDTISEIKRMLDNTPGINFPDNQKVSGKVDIGKIDTLPDLKVSNLSDIKLPAPAKIPDFPTEMDIKSLPPVVVSNLADLINRMDSFQNGLVGIVQSLQTKFPDSFSVKNEVKINQFAELLDGIEELKKGFNLLINKEAATIGFPDKEIPVMVTNQKFPNPVNNVWINALNGFVETTANTVGTNLVTLPNYGQLFNRRSLMIYNNSANTIYIGGSEVTTSNGIPVPAGAYSPIIDAGYNMVVYGIAATNGNDIRCLEVSKTKNEDVQE